MKGKHGPLDFDPGGRLIAGSVRNPWDWYVSLWAYGCGEQGGVQGLLKNSKLGTSQRIVGTAWRHPDMWRGALQDLWHHAGRDVAFWQSCYTDPHDPMAFRRWLKAVLSPSGRRLLGADYAARNLSNFAGFYTYRLLSVFTPVAQWRAHADDIRTYADVKAFFDRHVAVTAFIRNERLETDLAQVFAQIGRPDVTADILAGDRINASSRGRAAKYYDDETRALVAQSDPFFIEHFGYEAPKELT